jgi:hypothetical protein
MLGSGSGRGAAAGASRDGIFGSDTVLLCSGGPVLAGAVPGAGLRAVCDPA